MYRLKKKKLSDSFRKVKNKTYEKNSKILKLIIIIAFGHQNRSNLFGHLVY